MLKTIEQMAVDTRMSSSDVKAILKSIGALNHQGEPTRNAKSHSLVQVDGDQQLWDSLKIEPALKPWMLFCAQYKTLERIADGIVDLINEAAETLDVVGDFDSAKRKQWVKRMGIQSDTARAIVESEFGDPHFMGGPCAFVWLGSAEEVAKIFEKITPITNDLVDALRRHGHPEKAEFLAGAVDEFRSKGMSAFRAVGRKHSRVAPR